MIGGIFIYNLKGEVLVSKIYRADVKRSLADFFRIQVLSSFKDIRSPITTFGSTSFFHIKKENVYVVAVTKVNAHCSLVFELLYKIVELGSAFCGDFDEVAIKNNTALVEELLNEMIDAGYPQNTDTNTLKLLLTAESVISERPRLAANANRVTLQATGAVSWRRPDIKYKRNEAFIDVIESVNLLNSQLGTVLQASVTGKVVVRSYLSGMPECKLSVNDKLVLDQDDRKMNSQGMSKGQLVELDDCRFHQCVRLSKFDTERVISFIPPDGEFELMDYRATENINLPFKVSTIVSDNSRARIEYRISVKATFSSKLYAQNVLIKIPTPPNTASTKFTVSEGKAKYNGAGNCAVWKIMRIQGGAEVTLMGEAELVATSSQKTWSRPPINLEFEVLMFTSSGFFVRFFKVFEKSNYQSIKWIRYMTKAGSYQIRF